ncbi:LOW QUALITY PROTEIN: arginyl-tRNA--protein transferase 1 [Eutrema salsugineum]|nr:LOW QUALITY PROTEIN: arginyl-tRNA--protein transferase 1 [Eutrema salsugineum]
MSTKKVKSTNDASSSHGGGNDGESVIADHGRHKSTCGYCKSPARTSISHGLSAESLTVSDYQDFVPSKEQQRVSRRLERFLDGKLDVQPRERTVHTGASSSGEVSDSGRKTLGTARSDEKNKVEPILDNLSTKIDQAVQRCIQSGEFPSNVKIPKASVKKVFCAKRKKLAEGPEQLLYTSNIAFPIAAAFKRDQRSEKGEIHNAEENRLSPETISEMLLSAMSKVGEIPDVSIKVCKGHINFLSASKDSFSDRGVVLNDNISRGANSTGDGEILQAKKDLENHKARKLKLEMRLKRSSFDPEEHELYKRYQLKVHNDKPGHVVESSYRRFLVDSPLIYVQPSGDEKVPPCGFGSFHQQYRVDGRLIAVGVVDILPKCLSSVYLFWDPDYAFLSLGKYSALQEINWVRENQVHCPTLQYYYLGYYIHSCSKMRYKAAYRPSELLCPLRFRWVPFEVARPLLDKKPYVILSDITNSQNQCSLLPHASETLGEPTTNEHEGMEQGETNDHFMGGSDDEDEDDDDDDDDDDDEMNEVDSDPGSEDIDINNILIGLYGSQYRYKDLRQILTPVGRKQLEPMLQRYRKVVGNELSERMVYEIR